MTFDLTKGGKLRNVITLNVIMANLKTESCMYCWLRSHAIVDVRCFPALVGPYDAISSVLSIR